MVLLTTTAPMVAGLRRLRRDPTGVAQDGLDGLHSLFDGIDGPEGIEDGAAASGVGRPIAHDEVLQLWRALRQLPVTDDGGPVTLEALLVGAAVYVPPPPPKPEPSDEYKALMARLRRDEQARAYERMVTAPDPYATAPFAQVHRPVHAGDAGDDDVTFADIHRQLMLIANFVLTMGGVAYALWVLARWWPTPSRLFLAMAGSLAVGMAEYGLYAGYVWHLADAARKDRAPPKEVREVVQTWVVGAGADEGDKREGADEGKGQEDGGGRSSTASGDGKKDRRGEEDAARRESASRAADSDAVAANVPARQGASGVDGAQVRRRRKDAAA